jgi:stage V sporulation protein B
MNMIIVVNASSSLKACPRIEYTAMSNNLDNLKQNLLRGTLQLASAGVFVRLIGLVNRMVLSRLFGAEGLGLFQMILPFYALVAVAAGLGLPGAVTKMVADRYARRDLAGQLQVRTLAMRLAVCGVAAGSLLLWFGLSLPLSFIPDRRIVFALRLVPFAIAFAACSSVLRAFFQGCGNMAPTALSQVAEQILRIAVGLAAAVLLLPLGLEYALVGIVLGIIAGEIACFSVIYSLSPAKPVLFTPVRATGELLKEMFKLSFPILIIRIGTSITQTIESLMIPARLQVAGFTSSQATSLFGQFSGMALPLLFLPTVLIFPLNTTLVPAVAGALTLRLRDRLRRLINLSMWGTLLIGLLSTLVLYGFAEPLSLFLYGNADAAPLVMLLAPVAPFAYLQFTTAGILHGMGRPGIAVINDLAGTMVSLILIYHFAALPKWGINGVLCGYFAAFGLITVLDCLFIFVIARRVRP